MTLGDSPTRTGGIQVACCKAFVNRRFGVVGSERMRLSCSLANGSVPWLEMPSGLGVKPIGHRAVKNSVATELIGFQSLISARGAASCGTHSRC